MVFPADTFQEATEIAIEASNQLHGVINGDANAEVTVEDGSKIPSVRKAMVDSLYFKPPIAWAQGAYEDTYNQLREFVDGDVRTWWFAKGATVSTPVLMSTNPATDVNWTLWSAVTLNAATYETQKRLAAEAGLNMVGSFLLGATVTTTDDVVFYETDGKYYGWGGALPKVVPVGSTPATAGGIGALLWADRTDLMLRSDLNIVVKVFESVADMKADATLIIGQKCRTLGYYAVGDGGGNDYEIVAAATGTDDSGSYIDLSGSVFQAKGLFGSVVNVKQFGAVGDGNANDSMAVQNAVNFSSEVNLLSGTFKLSGVDIPEGHSLIGNHTPLMLNKNCKIIPAATTGYIFKLNKNSNLLGALFYEPNQKYTLTSNYIAESFNATAVPVRLVGGYGSVVKDCTVIGFNKFIEQYDDGISVGSIEVLTVENIRGFALDTAFDIKLSTDILKFKNIHLNLNSYLRYGLSTVDQYYYTKCALQARVFKFGRVDDAQIDSCFSFGVKRMFEFIDGAYTGDNGNGGGVSVVNSSADVCSQFFFCSRNSSSFGFSFTNCWATPIIKPLDGSTQCSFLIGDGTPTEANEIRVANFMQFGNIGHGVIDPARSGYAENFVKMNSGSFYNRFSVVNAQCIQQTGNVWQNSGELIGLTRNTFHGNVILEATPGNISLLDVDGLPLISSVNKAIFTHGIHNNASSITPNEGLASGSYTPEVGYGGNSNIASITYKLCSYIKVGNVVNVVGTLTITPTATGLVTANLTIPVPVATTIGSGTGAIYSDTNAVHLEKSVTNAIRLSFIASSVGTKYISFSYSYLTA